MSQELSSVWTVFISHSGTDTWVAQQIAREIEACGAVPFLDEANIAVGDDFEDRILDALEESKELVVLLTPWSLSRPYVWAELGAAWVRRIPIIGYTVWADCQRCTVKPRNSCIDQTKRPNRPQRHRLILKSNYVSV